MQNSEDRFKEIYKSQYQNVLRLCKGYTNGNEAMAKDLSQDVFVKILQNLESFREDAKISTWVYRITVNTCLLHLRRQKKQVTSSEPLKWIEADDKPIDVDRERQFKKLYGCINTLEKIDKSIILLELEGLPQKEIAGITGLSHAAIRTRVCRIKDKLKNCVEDGTI